MGLVLGPLPRPHFPFPQSTGLLTTGAHIFPDFCRGLPGKQLLLSSNATPCLALGKHSLASTLK